jgi:hypothetical protein
MAATANSRTLGPSRGGEVRRRLSAAADERFAGTLNVEAQAWLCAGPKLYGAELGAVFVDPRARDPELGGKGRRVDKSAGRGGGALAAHQLDHPSRDGLH